MTDDIVTRLRGLNTASYHLLCNEAADEIQRLRELCEFLERTNKLLVRVMEAGTLKTRQLLDGLKEHREYRQ